MNGDASAAAYRNGVNEVKDATAEALVGSSGILQTMQGHVDDIRGLLQCGICIRPLYEPFTLACGHTFCYSCLTSWFINSKKNKTCPDCRALVKAQPAPAYLIRAMVQLYTGRAELLDKGETTADHRKYQLEEAQKLDNDKANPNPRTGGLFRGLFKEKLPSARPIVDLEDGVVRCPECNWEIEDGDIGCARCGFRDSDTASEAFIDSGEESDPELNSEMTDYMDDEDDFDGEDDFDDVNNIEWNNLYDGLPFSHLPFGIQALYGHNGFNRIPHIDHYNSASSQTPSSAHRDSEESDPEDDDLDSFIEDDMHVNVEHNENNEDGEGNAEQGHDTQSDRSTVVGRPSFTIRNFHDDMQIESDAPSSDVSTPHPTHDDDEDIEGGNSEAGSSDGESFEVEDEDEENDEEDEDETPARLPTSSRLQGMQSLSRATNSGLRLLRPVSLRSINQRSRPRRREDQHGHRMQSTGSGTSNAINISDDSDEGPVRPTRRARGR